MPASGIPQRPRTSSRLRFDTVRPGACRLLGTGSYHGHQSGPPSACVFGWTGSRILEPGLTSSRSLNGTWPYRAPPRTSVALGPPGSAAAERHPDRAGPRLAGMAPGTRLGDLHGRGHRDPVPFARGARLSALGQTCPARKGLVDTDRHYVLRAHPLPAQCASRDSSAAAISRPPVGCCGHAEARPSTGAYDPSAATLLLMVSIGAVARGAEHHLRRWWPGPTCRKVREVSELRNPEAVPAALSKHLPGPSEGRLEASVDGCTVERDTTTCRLHMGRLYQWARLSRGRGPRDAPVRPTSGRNSARTAP